jgi:hypothetical protein
MMEVFVHIKGVLKVPNGDETYKSHKFTVRHDSSDKICEFINNAMMEQIQMQGVITPLDENKTTKGVEGFNNIQFWPMSNFSHLEIETRLLSAPTPDTTKVQVLN